MARPLKTNADYFSHDADMRNNRKVKALRARFGLEGYAIWCMLLECLTDEDGFRLQWNDLGIELLAGDFSTSAERLVEIVDYMVKIGLIRTVEATLTCPAHLERMQFVLEERERKRLWKQSKNGVNDGENNENDGENAQSKVKEIKGNKRKGEGEKRAQDEEGENSKKNETTAPPDDFEAVRGKIVEWAKPDNFSVLRALADQAGYDPARHGPISDEVTKFCAYYLKADRPAESRVAFSENPPGFFQDRAVKWLTDAKGFNRRRNNRASQEQSNAAVWEPPTRPYFTSGSGAVRSASDPTSIAAIIRDSS